MPSAGCAMRCRCAITPAVQDTGISDAPINWRRSEDFRVCAATGKWNWRGPGGIGSKTSGRRLGAENAICRGAGPRSRCGESKSPSGNSQFLMLVSSELTLSNSNQNQSTEPDGGPGCGAEAVADRSCTKTPPTPCSGLWTVSRNRCRSNRRAGTLAQDDTIQFPDLRPADGSSCRAPASVPHGCCGRGCCGGSRAGLRSRRSRHSCGSTPAASPMASDAPPLLVTRFKPRSGNG
jgi:hypothetical protein